MSHCFILHYLSFPKPSLLLFHIFLLLFFFGLLGFVRALSSLIIPHILIISTAVIVSFVLVTLTIGLVVSVVPRCLFFRTSVLLATIAFLGALPLAVVSPDLDDNSDDVLVLSLDCFADEPCVDRTL